MPGMMETILNLGLNEKSVEALAKSTQNERFAWDAYRRFVQMYSSVVIGLPKEDLEARLRAMKKYLNVTDDTQVTAEGWRQLVGEYKEYYKRKTGKPFPEGPEEQLWGAIGAVFESWMGEKAVTYRRVEKITGPAWHGRECGSNGVRQYGREFGYGRVFYPRSFHRRESFLRRFSAERAR